ncbi:phosphoribosyltransferase [Halorientalis litorea]|jgi:predicted phosphoribosyltransferase|uniref:phosphoribosyltransferase n=1 Tax=Halorientalis litorea TaxID=2931977 RepID=UPI001FF1E194|nr:phosphoribosyltransferase family protein [Halorientalis litorea]
MFRDRRDAGERLADRLVSTDVAADIVLAIPRGGLPLGRPVADALDAPLDVVVARKLGAPDNPEYAVGAVASDGTVWLNDDAVARTGVDDDYLEREQAEQAEAAREKAERYRDGPAPDLTDEVVVVVDDGVATGSTAFACIEQVRAAGADRIVVAIPVGPPDTVADLETVADEVVCLETPANFRAVGQFYERFDQVSDDEAVQYLDSGE